MIIKSYLKNSFTILEIDFKQQQQRQIDVFNIQGKNLGSIFKGINNLGLTQWRFSHQNYPAGLYFFRIQSSQSIQSQKFIIYK